MTRLAGIRSFDPRSGVLVCGAGTRIAEVLTQALPLGWRTVGMSGSAYDTVGGALGSNTHGKDTWWAGNFAENVAGFRMLTAAGEALEVDRDAQPELFHAVSGGLGLLGVVAEVRLQLTPAPSTAILHDDEPCPDLDHLVEAMRALDPASQELCYAHLERMAPGPSQGRSILHRGRFAEDRRETECAAVPGALARPSKIFGLREASFWRLARAFWTPSTFRVAGRFARRAYLRGPSARRIPFASYWYPQLKYPGSSRLFLPRGALELQAFADWDRAAGAFRALLGVLGQAGRRPWLSVVRRHRPSPSPLTFAGEGLSMTCIVPCNGLADDARAALLERYASTVADFDGRLCLTKSPWVDPATVAAMYPRWRELVHLKARLDPQGLLASDASDRLFAGG